MFRSRTPAEALDLIPQMLEYSPVERIKPLQACAHPFFDELRDPSTRLPSGAPLPAELFDFTETELSINPSLNEKLVPDWKRMPGGKRVEAAK